jgi:DNA-binding transcriptional ArsR family regulator
MQVTDNQIEVYTEFFHALSNPTRYRIILSLLDNPKNVGELAEDVGCSQSLVSMQLKCLKWCNYVESIKDGKNIYYSISNERIIDLINLGQFIAEGNNDKLSTCKILKNEAYSNERGEV